ncbi:hypothetical protein EC973_003930 [Apophysomyces ossiformis]|uniref:Uncharacterized protein n=1 Tax=Apophysomyces ossiformis TaxID=679940 RepID=A0A8H7BGP3_9FUNG|nr:hypothetical protein EC973_003930 [Apophysomyces ossiformis]
MVMDYRQQQQQQQHSQFPHFSGPQVDLTHTDQTHPGSQSHGYSVARDDTQRPHDTSQTSDTWGEVPQTTGTYGGAVWKDQPVAPHSYGEMASDQDLYPGRQGPPTTGGAMGGTYGSRAPLGASDYPSQTATTDYGTRAPMGAAATSPTSGGPGQTQYSGATEGQDMPRRKPSLTDKMKGTWEKMSGRLTGDQAKVIEGDERLHGRRMK